MPDGRPVASRETCAMSVRIGCRRMGPPRRSSRAADACVQERTDGGAVGYGSTYSSRPGRTARCGAGTTRTSRKGPVARRTSAGADASASADPAHATTQVQPACDCASCESGASSRAAAWCPPACPSCAAAPACEIAEWCGHGCSTSASPPQPKAKTSSAQRAETRNGREARTPLWAEGLARKLGFLHTANKEAQFQNAPSTAPPRIRPPAQREPVFADSSGSPVLRVRSSVD